MRVRDTQLTELQTQKEKTCETCIERIHRLSEFYKDVVSSSEKYTKTILTIVYAVFLSLFFQVESELSLEVRHLVLIYFFVSLSFFAINEIIKMIISKSDESEIIEILKSRPSGFNRAMVAFDTLSNKRHYVFNRYINPFIFYVSLILGISAGVLFFGSYLIEFCFKYYPSVF